jgi:hypothetical protein
MPAAALSGHLFLSQETSSLILLLPKLQGEQELPAFYLNPQSLSRGGRLCFPNSSLSKDALAGDG